MYSIYNMLITTKISCPSPHRVDIDSLGLDALGFHMNGNYGVGKMLFSFFLNLRGYPMCGLYLDLLGEAAVDVNVAFTA